MLDVLVNIPFSAIVFSMAIWDGELGKKEKSMSRLIIMIHTRKLSLSFDSNSAVPINTGSTNHDPTK